MCDYAGLTPLPVQASLVTAIQFFLSTNKIMIVTNLAAGMILVSSLDIIQTNTPAFQEYAYHTMVTNAQAVAASWHLDENLMATNNITFFKAAPNILGITGGITFSERYEFGYFGSWLDHFKDIPNNYEIAHTDNLETNDAILVRWMRATNLLTMEKAKEMTQLKAEAINIPVTYVDFTKKNEIIQPKYEWKDGKAYPLPYYVFSWREKKYICRFEISGISSNIVGFFALGPGIRLHPPSNYFKMLGLPENPVFVRRLSLVIPGQPPAYEVVFDSSQLQKR